MRAMLLAKLCIYLLLSAPLQAFAEQESGILSESDLRGKCSENFGPQVAIRRCVEEAATTSEKTLKQAEDYALASLSGWETDKEYIDLAKTRLIAAGKTFEQFRADQCSFAASLGASAIGAALEMRRNACIAELNLRRAKQLRDFMDTLP
jgi:uncharacterized protein YecT (DUF1311 family)